MAVSTTQYLSVTGKEVSMHGADSSVLFLCLLQISISWDYIDRIGPAGHMV